MSFNYGHVIVPDTNATGALRTTGDSSAQQAPGTLTTHYTSDGWQTFVYVYAESALTSQKGTFVTQRGGVLGGIAAVAVADSQYVGYVGAPAAAITSSKYGWVQIEGPVTAMAGLVSEARTAGGQMDHTSGKLAYLSSGATGTTINSVFGSVRVLNTASSTTGNVHLYGREISGQT